MKTLVKLVLGIVGLYLVLMLGSGLVAKAMLSGSRIQTLLSSLQAGWPAQVSASGGDFDLVEWFRFRPVVTIRDLAVTNPPGFSNGRLLEAKEVSAQVGLFSLFGGTPQVQRLTLQAPTLNVEEDRAGKTNLEVLIQGITKGGGGSNASKGGGGGLAIDEFGLREGTIRFLEAGRKEPTLTVQDLDVALTDFGSDRSCVLKMGARLFNGRNSRLDFTGRAGPSSSAALPAKGTLTLGLAPAEIPQALRTEYCGDLLRDAPANARVSLEASLKGDLMATLHGGGKLVLENFQAGRDQAHRIGLKGEAPLRLTIRRPLTVPSFDIQTQDALLQLGDGKWKGRGEVHYNGSTVQGASNGAISGVDIDQMLSTFTSAKGKLSGVAEIPDYQLRFAGRNATEIRNSLSGQGNLKLDKGRLAMFDLLDSIDRSAKRVLTGDAPASGQTSYTRFQTHFQIGGQRVELSDLALENPTSQTTGQGYLTFSEQMSFDLVSKVSGPLAQLLGGRPDASGQLHAQVPVRVRGTMDSPRVAPDVGRIAVDQLKQKAGSFLDRLLQPKK